MAALAARSAGAGGAVVGRKPARAQPQGAAATATPPAPAVSGVERKVAGKTVVVTGGSQGSGLAAARLFATKGWNVALCARQPGRLEEAAAGVAALLEDGEARVLWKTTDLTSEDEVKEFAALVDAKYESIDVVVNCAGVCCSGEFEATTTSDFEDQFQANLMSCVNATRALLPSLKRSGKGGVIVNVNSFGGRIPLKGMTAYTATKFALDGFSKSLALELRDQGVRVAQVHPGVIGSSFMERAQFRGERGAKAKASMEKLLGEGGGMVQTPDDIAKAILKAVEEKKSEVVVGASFNVLVGLYRWLGVNVFGMLP